MHLTTVSDSARNSLTPGPKEASSFNPFHSWQKFPMVKSVCLSDYRPWGCENRMSKLLLVAHSTLGRWTDPTVAPVSF